MNGDRNMKVSDFKSALKVVLDHYGERRPPSLKKLFDDLDGQSHQELKTYLTNIASTKKSKPPKSAAVDTEVAYHWIEKLSGYSGSVDGFRELVERFQAKKANAATVRAVYNHLTKSNNSRISRPKAYMELIQSFAAGEITTLQEKVAGNIFQ